MDIVGARPEKPSKYTPIATLKWIGGLQTQRSPFASIDTRYNSRYLGGKPDSLIGGSNCEINNKLTLQRRPGLVAYGTASIPSPDFFYSWQQSSLSNFIATVDSSQTTYPNANLQLIVDTATNGTSAPGSIYNYSPTKAGIILNKSALSQQTSFQTVVNTLYMGDGVDLYKLVGTNLLSYSNNFGNGTNPQAPWAISNATITTGQTDPTGQTNASYVVFSSASTSSFVQQSVTPNYIPVASNTFTLSVWMKANTGAPQINLLIEDQASNSVVNTTFSLSTSWKLYQVTGTALNTATGLQVSIYNPNSTSAHYFFYGAQLEVGGPATPTTITLNKPNGVYLWGIQAPNKAPTFTFKQQFGNTGKSWLPNHAYSQTNEPITAVAATAALATPIVLNGTTYTNGAVYTTSFSAGSSNGLAGQYFSCLNGSGGTLAAANQSTAPGFLCIASTSTTLTLFNTAATAQGSLSGTVTATLLDSIVDSNGNLQIAYTPGTSGSANPLWAPTFGQATDDGLQNFVVQTNNAQASGTSVSAAFASSVTATDTKIILVASSNSPSNGTPGTPSISDSSGDTPTLLAHTAVSNIAFFLYYVLSATAGATTITVTSGGNQATWVGIAEIDHMTAIDVHATNTAQRSTSVVVSGGSLTTTNALDVILTAGLFAVPNGTQGYSNGNIPSGFQGMVGQGPTAQGTGFWNMDSGFTLETATGTYTPQWTITNATTNSNDSYQLITAAFKSSVGKLIWYNAGPLGLTSTSVTNYQYCYSFVNTYTGHRSNISPFSTSTGAFAGQAITVAGNGMMTATTSGDPQVDAIEVYRSTDGGAIWYQIPPNLMTSMSGTITDANGKLYLANPGTTASDGTWSFVDTVPDSSLDTQICAPISLLNSTPPAGLTNLTFWSGRVWGSVANVLYYATGPDDTALLNILQNGVPSESWYPLNYITFNSQIVRSVPTGAGLIVFTTTDVWVIAGSNNATYTQYPLLTNIGLGNYNALVVDGTNIMFYTRDGECLMMSVGSGITEIGFPIGDQLEENVNPATAYLARHVKGSQDNAFYVGNGSTGWYRLNPNQYGASAGGEQTPIWSPPATITGGCNALASIEVSPGVKLLLVGGTSTGPILNRSITTFTDNGSAFTWSATMGSVVLSLPGMLSVVESITTEMVTSNSTQCGVGVLLNEISGVFETLVATNTQATNDPPQLNPSTTVLSTRFFLSPGTTPPICRNIQIQFSGAAVGTQDEILAVTLRGEVVNEQA